MKKEKKSPKHLKHKPIISVNNYSQNDAMYANDTDAVALSIGKAQWDSNQISLKVWRHTGKKWSRQSEELPIHRNLDLSILFLSTLLSETSDNDIESIFTFFVDNHKDVSQIKIFYEQNKRFIKPRIQELKKLLDKVLTN